MRKISGNIEDVSAAIRTAAEDVKPLILHMDCSQPMSYQEFFAKAKESFRFPNYFGMNWTAFDECISDFSFVEEDHIVIIFSGMKAFAQREPAGAITPPEEVGTPK